MSVSCELLYAHAPMADGTEEHIPYWHLDSGQPGESFLVLAAQHGIEVQGCEVVRRFRDLCLTELRRGQVYLVPFACPPAVRARRSHLHLQPEQPVAENKANNMNLLWPGDPQGNETERVAYALHGAVVDRCTCCLDLHSWSRFTATAALAREDVPRSVEMGLASGFRFLELLGNPRTPHAGMLENLFSSRGQGAISVELTGQWVVREPQVREGVRCATNLARLCRLFDGEPERLDGPVVRFHQNTWRDSVTQVMAPCDGLFVEAGLHTSDRVEAGQHLGRLIRADDLETVDIIAPVVGYLYSYGCFRSHSDVQLPALHPYAEVGDVLAGIMQP